MKIGDLVTLSSYGRKRRRANWIESGDVGIIMKIRKWGVNLPDDQNQDYLVRWTKSDYNRTRADRSYAESYYWESYSTRKDLKYVK